VSPIHQPPRCHGHLSWTASPILFTSFSSPVPSHIGPFVQGTVFPLSPRLLGVETGTFTPFPCWSAGTLSAALHRFCLCHFKIHSFESGTTLSPQVLSWTFARVLHQALQSAPLKAWSMHSRTALSSQSRRQPLHPPKGTHFPFSQSPQGFRRNSAN